MEQGAGFDWGSNSADGYVDGNGVYDAAYSPDQSSYAGYDLDEYYRVDGDVYSIFLELAPDQQGESVALGELPELCQRVGRPLRDDHEQFRLMQELDTTNAMVILRHDFVNWLLAEKHAQEEARAAAEPKPVPVATPAWEEVVQEVAEDDLMLGSKPTVFYYNTLSGESIWELPSLVRCLWTHLEALETAQQETQVSADGVPAFVRPRRCENTDDTREMLQQLRELFVKYDDDKTGYLPASEFEDLCVHVGQAVNGPEGLMALMREVDPFGAVVPALDQSEQQGAVSWEGLRHYWIVNAPFQRRTRLGETRYSSWERVDVLHRRSTPILFRHTVTQQERWCHPAMEQRVADRLSQFFPSSKLDWGQKIDLFLDVQRQQVGGDELDTRSWRLETVWRMLSQLQHPMSRRQHVQSVMLRLQQQFGDSLASEEDTETIASLDEAVVRAWLLYCTKKVDMAGWEELQDAEGQTYYYHEVDGTTQWDPPQLQSQMASMLSKLGGSSNLSVDEQIARVFRQYDADESGEMTLDEFQHFYRALLGRGGSTGVVSDAQIRQFFGVLDASGDGSVTLEEFQFWWKTKLQLDVKESEEVETVTREQRRYEICHAFLDNADAIVLVPISTGDHDGVESDQHGPRADEHFESNLMPRLAALLGEFSLRGLAYRRALNELVSDPMEQLVSLARFLVWYDAFERAEREKLELHRAKQRAQAELRAQHEAQAAARQKQRRRRKQVRTLDAISAQSAALTEQEAQHVREKKIAVLFKTFDTDGSGLLDEQELLQLTKALGHDMDPAQIGRMVRVMDSSGDGRVNLEEFLAFWKAFEHRRAPAATAAVLHDVRRDAVSEPVAATAAPLSTGAAMASLAVSLEMAKDRALKLTMADLRGFLTDWRDDLRDKRLEHKAEVEEAEAIKKWRELHAFVPTKKRVYGAKRLDVTWIEPEVVDCVAAIIVELRQRIDPPLKPDAAQMIQSHVRGHLARKHVLERVQRRFQKCIDLQTHLFYFVDTHTGRVSLTRPVFPSSTSSVAPLELDDCKSKAEKYRFRKRLAELQAKKLLYDSVCLPALSPDTLGDEKATKGKQAHHHRPMLAPSAFYMYDIASFVQQRLYGNIWTPLRSPKPDLVLAELIARRRRRQLMQRGRDAAANLPLHYAVRHAQVPVSVIRAFVEGYPEALAECDAFGMTPLHLAFRERRSDLELLQLLARRPRRVIRASKRRRGKDNKAEVQRKLSVWARQTVCGDTPLHVAIHHRASVVVLQWALPTCAAEGLGSTSLRNKHGESAFHACITQQQQRQLVNEGSDFTSPRSRTAVLLFFKHLDPIALCATPTRHGELPLHLALDACEQLKQRSVETPVTTGADDSGWFWLIKLLLSRYPEAVLVPKRSNGLLPVQLAIKYGLPEELLVQMFTLTEQCLPKATAELTEEQTLLEATTIRETRTTLLHYALIHRPRATQLLSMIIERMPRCCSMDTVSTGDLPIHAAAAARGLALDVLHRLCEAYTQGCRTYNAKRHLPLHVAVTHDVHNVEKVSVLLQHCQELVLADKEERRGLRLLLMAASTSLPDYRVLLKLLDVAPSRKLASMTSKATSQRSVTPLYALSLRRCTPKITTHHVAQLSHDKFEELEDEDAYFLAMAKAKLRKQHYNPTAKWPFPRILELVELNPLDEALIQRALLATNEKLQGMIDAELQGNQDDGRNGYTSIVDSVTLNSDLMLVRTVHQLMFEFPSNPRLQLLGQAILSKLLPTAFVRAAYKSKVDPYFNL